MNFLTFNGKSSLDFEMEITGTETYNAPSRDVEFVQIKGRNGDLIIDNGRYNNIEVTYPCFIVNNFKKNMEAMRNFFLQNPNYFELRNTYNPNEFRLASYSNEIVTSSWQNRAGSFDLIFNCKPQRFLDSGMQKVNLTTNTLVLLNPTVHTALPLIYVESGTGTININDVEIKVLQNQNGIVVNSEIQDCYSMNGNLNVNSNVEFNTTYYPVLLSGKNEVSCSNEIKAYLIPRWFVL